jgi:hypothetical protein
LLHPSGTRLFLLYVIDSAKVSEFPRSLAGNYS